MYKIAVCDDEEFICTKIEQTMVHYGERYGLELKICVFYTGERLLQALQDAEGCFDLLFLDIGLRSMNGISVAEVIREKMGNEEMLIVYISSRQEYAMQLFKTRPMDFLVKPVSREELIAAFLKAKKLLDRGNEMFEYKVKNIYYKMPYSRIFYFQSAERKIILYYDNGRTEFYDKLDNIAKCMNQPGFWRIHKSYLVNSRYVVACGYEALTMMNGDELPISQSKRREMRKMLLDVRKEKIRGYKICD